LLLVNLLALATVLALGCTFIPLWGANGAALAASLGELILAVAAFAMLVRARPALRPNLRYVPKLLLAAAVGGACVLLPLPDAVAAALALLIYGALAWLLRAVPTELLAALQRRPASAGGENAGPPVT
jgi:O-antigen/teichoic acid export membrane protein